VVAKVGEDNDGRKNDNFSGLLWIQERGEGGEGGGTVGIGGAEEIAVVVFLGGV